MGVARILVRGTLFGGPGAELTGRRRIFEYFRKFLKKIAKMNYFNVFFKKFNKPYVNSWLKGKHKLLRNFQKILRNLC